MEHVKIFELMWVEQAAGVFFGVPEVNIVGVCIIFEAVNESMVSKQVFGLLNVLGDKLSDASKVRNVGLPSVGYLPVVVVCGTDAVSEVFVSAEVSKKLYESGLRDCLAKSPNCPV